MKREMLTLMSATFLVCGCAGRVETDLLQAKIREQAAQLTESQQQLERSRAELKQTRMEAARMKAELEHPGAKDFEDPSLAVIGVKIHALSSGGMNKDHQPGDDVIVLQFAPLDAENRPIQAAGHVELTLLDPLMPEADRELGHWTFTANECRTRWTRGITSSGYQFSLPLNQPPRHANLIIQLRYQTADDRTLQAKQIVKVVVPPLEGDHHAATIHERRARKAIPVENDQDESLPLIPGGETDSRSSESAELEDWDSDASAADLSRERTGRAVLHSSNWTDATIPVLR